MESSATAALYTSHVLKDGDSFLIANGYGDIAGHSDGLFHNDTRLLSRYRLHLGEAQPALLNASVSRDNVFFVAHLTNRALAPIGESGTPQGLVHIARTRFLFQERMYERIACTNYDARIATLPLRFALAADFRDMFEVRGSVRKARGEMLVGAQEGCQRLFRYRGLDGVLRSACIAFSQAPAPDGDDEVALPLRIEPGATVELYVEAGRAPEPALPSRARFRRAATQARLRMRHRQRRGARVSSNGPLFDEWMRRSRSDLALLTSELPSGPYPYAGIPWFSTPFGRDAVITALQTLWLDPGLARGVLQFLAEHQAQEESAFLDAAPGKILHETRKGEMASLRELPFGLYYGGVDTTPLFVMLAGAYARRTGEMDFIDGLWPALRAATAWIERVCDANPWGLLDYARRQPTGLSNQGWKDSEDSVFHADGRFPAGPIALVEVQGYAYAALQAMAALGRRRGRDRDAAQWEARAERLRRTVQERFWMPEQGYYGIAVDGEGRLCEVRASNAGHLLYVGLADEARARQVAEQLMSPAFHSGWGLRTLAKGQARYNPMSYHNGSVWPHDSALCASGIARYHGRATAARLLRSAFETAVHFEMRLPELYCGFARRAGAPPIPYPVACLPQAWAAGSPFMLLQACLGVEVDGEHGVVHVDRPHLPPGIEDVRVRGLVVGEERVDLVFKQFGDRVGVFSESRHAQAIPVNLRS